MNRLLYMSSRDGGAAPAAVVRDADPGVDGVGVDGVDDGRRSTAHASAEAAALAGDAAAWAALIAQHNHKIVVALLARGISLDQARELTQETWLRLMQQQRTGRLSHLTLPGLAIVQAGFLAANLRRRAAVAAQTLPLEATAGLPTGTGSLEDGLIGRQRLERLAQALEACPSSARRVFEQVYDHPELSYAEVAPRVGLSVARVKQIVFEVRKRLRAALEDDDDREDRR
jgi:RNA polymerase sigma factor (sigma-70 family)